MAGEPTLVAELLVLAEASAELGRYDPASLASRVGSDPETILNGWALAEATDDLEDSSTAVARGLRQLATRVQGGGGRAIFRI